MMTAEILPEDHLERLFGRDLKGIGWTVEFPEPANDDILLNAVDPAILNSLLKRRKR